MSVKIQAISKSVTQHKSSRCMAISSIGKPLPPEIEQMIMECVKPFDCLVALDGCEVKG